MFETSSWNLHNRRSFAVLQHLGDMAGTGVVLAGNFEPLPSSFSPAQRAMALAEAADHALALVVETAAGSASGRGGPARSVWKRMTPARGADAVIFLAHGLAETTAQLAAEPSHHLDAGPQSAARKLLQTTFPWSDEDDAEVEELASQIDPETGVGAEEAQVDVAFGAVKRIVGQRAADLPGFAGLAAGSDIEGLTGGLAWQICFNHGLPPYLTVSDPEGMAHSPRGL